MGAQEWPQGWWIHIAQLDMTDFIKETLLGVAPDASWSTAIAESPGVMVVAAVVAAALAGLLYRYLTRKAPPADNPLRVKADPLPPALQGAELYRSARGRTPLLDWSLAEKVALTSLVATIFVSMLPGLEAGLLHVSVAVGLFVVLNTAISHWMARRGRGWASVAREFATMMLVNAGLVLGLELAEGFIDLGLYSLSLGATLFFLFLLTLIIVMFDRYRAVWLSRTCEPGSAAQRVFRPGPASA